MLQRISVPYEAFITLYCPASVFRAAGTINKVVGRVLWCLSTCMIMFGLPFMIEVMNEQNLALRAIAERQMDQLA